MKKNKIKTKTFIHSRCPFGHELYAISVASSKPFCPACGWVGNGSMFSKAGKAYWLKCQKMDYVDYANLTMTSDDNKIGIVYEKENN